MKSNSSPIHNIYFDLCNHYNLRSWATRIHYVMIILVILLFYKIKMQISIISQC